MISTQSKFTKVAGLCGVLVPIVAFTFIALSIYYSSGFSWSENWLSELAGNTGEEPIWAARGLSSLLFNIGVVIAGILGLICAIAARRIRILDSSLGRLGILLLIVDTLALCAIGVFPLTTGHIHDIVSFVFFILVPLSLILIGNELRKSPETKFGWFMLLLGVISFFSFPPLFVPQPWGGNAIIEMIPATSISACAIAFGVSLLTGKFDLRG